MDADDYHTAGVAIAVSMVHGGPSPRFLSDKLFQALIDGPDKVTVSLENLMKSDIKHDLQKVCDVVA